MIRRRRRTRYRIWQQTRQVFTRTCVSGKVAARIPREGNSPKNTKPA
jgi:hypothetical protein